MNVFHILAALALTTSLALAAPPRVVQLWPEGVPGLKPNAAGEKVVEGRITEIHQPSLLVFPGAQEKSTGTSIILSSGGGYVRIAVNPNGDSTVKNLNELGITVFVLKYRLADYGHPAPLQDILRAVRIVRKQAGEFGVSPERIGVMGTSAGGHLSGCAATLWDHADGKTGAAMDSVSARPDFAILIYPVVSLSADFTHRGSREALLGKSPAPGLAETLSLEKQVRKNSPPFFIAATMADTVVPVMNSLNLYQELSRAGVPSEIHIYAQGDHSNSRDPKFGPTATWPLRLEEWLRFNGWLEKPQPSR
jgi:acetyl esterase/lipase